MISAALLLAFALPAAEEPDGARPASPLPAYRGQPAPPPWLRAAAQARAGALTPHYIYEAYAGNGGLWLVRFVRFPEDGDSATELETVLLFEADPGRPPAPLKAREVQFQVQSAKGRGKAFLLVDRRDLQKP